MKKHLLIRSILCAGLLSLSFFGCGGGKDYRNLLPDDSFIIMSANLESLGRKANAGDPKQGVFYNLIENVIGSDDDMTDADRERILSLIADISQAGIDRKSDCFMFMKMKQMNDMRAGFLFRLQDVKKFEEALDLLIPWDRAEKKAQKGFTVITSKRAEPFLIAWSNEAAMLYLANESYESNLARVTELFNQKRSKSLVADREIVKAFNAGNDITMVACYANMPDDIVKLMKTSPMFGIVEKVNVAMSTNFEKINVVMSTNFEKGRVVSDALISFPDGKTRKEFLEQADYMSRQSGSLLKFIPESSVITIGANITGNKMYEYFAAMPQIDQILGSVPQIKTLTNAMKGDMIVSFNKMDVQNRFPVATIVAELGDIAAAQSVFDMLGALLPATSTAPYQYETGSMLKFNVWFGIQDNVLYATTDPAVKSAIKGGSMNSIENRFGAAFKGNYSTVTVDFQALAAMLEAMMANGTVTQGAAYIMPLLRIFDTWEIYSDEITSGTSTVYMIDRERNSLDVIYHTFETMVRNMVGPLMMGFTLDLPDSDGDGVKEEVIIAEIDE